MKKFRVVVISAGVITGLFFFNHQVQARSVDPGFIVRYQPPLLGGPFVENTDRIAFKKLNSFSEYYVAQSKNGLAPISESELRRVHGLTIVQPNYEYKALFTPNDPSYGYQWNFTAIHAPAAWDYDTVAPTHGGSPAVIVAVIDTGIAYENFGNFSQSPELSGTSFVQGIDIVNGDSHPNDDVGHGTHVASTIAQMTDNGVGGAGLAFNVSLMPIKVLDESGVGMTSDIASGVAYAHAHGAHVINLSLGGTSNDPLLHAAIQDATNAGVIVIAATGNDNTPSVYYPARFDEVLAVGAVAPDFTRAYYSNYGSGIDLVAPGGDMRSLSTGGILQMTCQQAVAPAIPCTTSVTPTFAEIFYQGTSMATPHVSAAAALLLSAGVASDTIGNVLRASAQDLGSTGYDTSFGWGLLDISSALNVGLNDSTPPTGTISVNGGADFVGTTTVTLTLSATDVGSSVSEMSFSNNGTEFSPWEEFTTVKTNWDLSTFGGSNAEGKKKVWAKYRDAAGNISSAVYDEIGYDRFPPDKFSIRALPYNQTGQPIRSGVVTSVSRFEASWGTPSDSGSSVIGYKFQLSASKTPAISSLAVVQDHQFISAPQTSGRILYLHVAAIDAVGHSRISTFTYVYRPVEIFITDNATGEVRMLRTNGKNSRKFYPYGTVVVKNLQGSRLIASLNKAPTLVFSADNKPTIVTSLSGKVLRSGFGDATYSRTLATGNIGGNDQDEVLVTPNIGNHPLVILNATGKFIRSFWPFGTTYQNGFTAAVAQSKTGPNIVVAEKNSSGNKVRIFTPNGKVIKQFNGLVGGMSLATADVNNDGVDEIIIGRLTGIPAIRIYSLTGKVINTLRPFSGSRGVLVKAVDIDGNGTSEIIALPPVSASVIKVLDLLGTSEKVIRPSSPVYSKLNLGVIE